MTTGRFPVSPAMARHEQMIRCLLRNLIWGITLLSVKLCGEPDYVGADSDVLRKVAQAAELAVQTIHDGLAAIGTLHTHSTQQIADGRLRIVQAAARGRSQIELWEVLSYACGPGIDCRRHTADYVAREGRWP